MCSIDISLSKEQTSFNHIQIMQETILDIVLWMSFFFFLFFQFVRPKWIFLLLIFVNSNFSVSKKICMDVCLFACVIFMCVFLAYRGRIIVDLQGLETMSRGTQGTHTQSVSQWNAANSYLMLPHRHCPPCSTGQGRAGSSETEQAEIHVMLVIMFFC